MSDSLENDTANIRKLWDRFPHIPPKIMVSNTNSKTNKNFLVSVGNMNLKKIKIKTSKPKIFWNNKSNIQTNFLYISCGKFPTQRKFIVVFVLVRVDRFISILKCWGLGVKILVVWGLFWNFRLEFRILRLRNRLWNFEYPCFFIKNFPCLMTV